MERRDAGFTLIELLVVVLIIGILVSVAVPMFVNSVSRASERSCHQNQRQIEGAVSNWMAMQVGNDPATLAGVVDADNPLMTSGLFKVPPRCPSAPAASDILRPTVAEGAYTLDGAGSVVDCTFGFPYVHNHY